MEKKKRRFATGILIVTLIRDLLIGFLPGFIVRLMIKKGDYAFLIHPRDLADVSRKYPFAKKFMPSQVEWVISYLWPMVGSRVTGLKSKDGRDLVGYVVVCPLSAQQMIKDRSLAKRKILSTVKFAEKLGCKVVGLGAWSASMTDGGLYLRDRVKRIGVTTGHAYTTLCIWQTVEAICQKKGLDLSKQTVAILGAAGFMGTACSKLISQQPIGELLLIDKPQKSEGLQKIQRSLDGDIKASKVTVSTNIHDLLQADVVVVVTSATEVIVKPEHLKSGAIIVDDTQPRNTSSEIIKERPDVLVLDVVATVPGVNAHFPLDFPLPNDVFTCLGEVLILAANGYTGHYALGDFDFGLVEEVSELSGTIGIRPAPFRSFNRLLGL